MHVCRISGNINTHDRDRVREGEVAAGSMRHEHPGAASRKHLSTHLANARDHGDSRMISTLFPPSVKG